MIKTQLKKWKNKGKILSNMTKIGGDLIPNIVEQGEIFTKTTVNQIKM